MILLTKADFTIQLKQHWEVVEGQFSQRDRAVVHHVSQHNVEGRSHTVWREEDCCFRMKNDVVPGLEVLSQHRVILVVLGIAPDGMPGI